MNIKKEYGKRAIDRGVCVCVKFRVRESEANVSNGVC